MSEHLNFCRQMVKQFSSLHKDFLDHSPYGVALDSADMAQKFMLPDGGRLLDDMELRALDETQPLRLPFPVICLEYRTNQTGLTQGQSLSTKRIVFAHEDDEMIVVYPVIWMDELQAWGALPPAALPLTGYLNRNSISADGGVFIICTKADPSFPYSDYCDELGALLGFLNALQCSNVHVERSPARKSGKKIKSALPFDDYHVLQVALATKPSGQSAGGTHRSPREHLRRGHIRTLQSGKRIWVNAAVVGAGANAGKIFKDYAIHH